MPHFWLNVSDIEPFECNECGRIVEYLEVEYSDINTWVCRWQLGCALHGPFIGPTEDAIEWLIEKVLYHYKFHYQGPSDVRPEEIQSIIDELKQYVDYRNDLEDD